MYIKQISVYLENVRGTLREMTKLLAENDIDIMALSIADTTSFGIVRIIVRESSIERAVKSMKEAGFMVKTSDVICVCVPNKPAGLDSVLGILDEVDISIEYMYSFNYSVNGDALLILRLSNNEKVIELLQEKNIKIYTQEEVNKL